MNNKLVLNPAVAGYEKFMEIRLGYRYQWVGFDDAPKTQLLSVHSSMDKKKYGLGGYIYNDKIGPLQNTGISFSYAYHTLVAKELHFSFGLSGSLGMFGVDGDKIVLSNENDDLIDSKMNEKKLIGDAAFGVFCYSKLFYGGLSVLHLPENRYKIFDGSSAINSERHYYLIGGYDINFNQKYSLTPNIYVNYMVNNPVQADINLTIDYDKLMGFGLSYRTNDAIMLLFEFTVLQNLEVSYSYDVLVSSLRKQSSGSHELFVAYRYYYNPQYRKVKARYKIKKIKVAEDPPDR